MATSPATLWSTCDDDSFDCPRRPGCGAVRCSVAPRRGAYSDLHLWAITGGPRIPSHGGRKPGPARPGRTLRCRKPSRTPRHSIRHRPVSACQWPAGPAFWASGALWPFCGRHGAGQGGPVSLLEVGSDRYRAERRGGVGPRGAPSAACTAQNAPRGLMALLAPSGTRHKPAG